MRMHWCLPVLAALGWAVGPACAKQAAWSRDGVPAPEAAHGKVTVGAYVFPGWYRDRGRGDYPYRTHDEDSEWRQVAKYPGPRPLLGFYDDSLPEVNDWHIKWALEHGISFFAFDWYWNAGEHRLLRTLEEGFLKARYCDLMKFCIHWCNHGLDWRRTDWYPMMGMSDFEVVEGVMKARVTSNDPAFACDVDIDASEYRHAAIKMRLSEGENAQLFWTTATRPEDEDSSIHFETVADGEFHEYQLDLGALESWEGRVIRLRLDPNSGHPGSIVEVDYVRLAEQAGTEGGRAWEFNEQRGGTAFGNWGLDFSREALIEMVEYLADNYFKLPNYLTIEGRPVLIIWDSRALINAHGGPSGFREALAAMNAVLRSRGLGDLYLVSIGGAKKVEEAGFSATTGYGHYGVDYDSAYEWRGGYSVPYEEVVGHYETVWRGHRDDELPYILPIGSNWDNRPRAGEHAAVITGKTPGKFRVMCESSLDYIDERVNMAIIEAWNEWGEGSFIEPDREWRFGFLDVVREVFTDAPIEHIDYVPDQQSILGYSILRGEELARAREIEDEPQPDPPVLRRTVHWQIDATLPETDVVNNWEFNQGGSEGWAPYHVEPFQIGNGILSTRVSAHDPQLIVDEVGVDIAQLQCLGLRLRVSEGAGSCQLFWTTEQEPQMSPDKALRFPLRGDGRWHTYQIMKQVEGKWSGTLRILRLDIGQPGDMIELDWVRLWGRKE